VGAVTKPSRWNLLGSPKVTDASQLLPCPSWVIQTRSLQIQDGGRRPSWKNRKIAIFQQLYDRSPREIWQVDAFWPSWAKNVSSRVEKSQYLGNALTDVQNLAQWRILTLQTRSAVKITGSQYYKPSTNIIRTPRTLCPCITNYQYPHGSCLPVPSRDTWPPCWRCCKYVSYVR